MSCHTNKSEIKQQGFAGYCEKQTFNKIYEKIYDKYCSSRLFDDIVQIIETTENIPSIEISEMIKRVLQTGVLKYKSKLQSKHNSNPNDHSTIFFTLDYHDIENIAIYLAKKNLLTTHDVDIILDKLAPNYRFFGCSDNVHKWIEMLLDKGYVITCRQKDILKKLKYAMPIKIYFEHIKKITTHDLTKYIKLKNGLTIILNHVDQFVEIVKTHKITLTFQMYLYLLKNYDICRNSCMDIINLFSKCNYQFDIKDLLIAQHSYIHFSKDYPNSKIHKNFYVFDEMLKFVKEKGIDEKEFISESVICFSDFLDYLLKNNKLDLIPQNLGIICAILHNNESVVEYYAKKKYIGTEKDLLFTLYHCLKQIHYNKNDKKNSQNLFDCFIKTGSVVTSKVFQTILLLGKVKNQEYSHLFSGNLSEKTMLENKMHSIAFAIRCEHISNKHKSKKQKIILIFTQKSQGIFEEICAKNELCDILAYMKTYNVSLTSTSIEAIFCNPRLEVVEYFKFKYDIKPSLRCIILNPSATSRYFLTLFYYPELINTEYDLTTILEADKKEKQKSQTVMYDDKENDKTYKTEKKQKSKIFANNKTHNVNNHVDNDVNFDSDEKPELESEDEVLIKKPKTTKKL